MAKIFPLATEFFSTLGRFEKEHTWWSDSTYRKMDNTSAQQAIRQAMGKYSDQFRWFACTATKDDMHTFSRLLRANCPRLSMLTLAQFLDYLHTQEALQEEVSKDIVLWYREQLWQFPQFAFEKIESQPKAEEQAPTQDAQGSGTSYPQEDECNSTHSS